jgi:hypothetical protein
MKERIVIHPKTAATVVLFVLHVLAYLQSSTL